MRYIWILTRIVVLAVALAATAPTITRPAAAQEPVPAVVQVPFPEKGAGLITLDFQEVGLAYVFSALAQAASLNIMHVNLPDDNVTLRSARPVPIANIPALIRSLARMNRIAVVEEGGFLRLTGPADSDQVPDNRSLFIHRLRHAQASALAPTLQGLFSGGTGNLNVIASTGPQRPQTTQRPRRSQPQQPQPQPQPPITVRSPNMPPGIQVGGLMIGGMQSAVQIVPDEVTNTLLVRATPEDWMIIEKAVEALDLRPLQVAIEVVIAEVRRRDDLQFGVRVGAGPAGATSAEDFTVRLDGSGNIDIRATLQALSATGNVHILSRPVVMAQNNREARILVGSERPFVQMVSRSIAAPDGVRDQVIQYRDVGTVLTIMPTINEEGYVNLALTQEVSSATTETLYDAPVISTRVAETQLLARDGETVVIGGLVDRREDRVRTGIPLLKDIPLIGMLFRSTRNIQETSELFLFLTPYIVADDEDAKRLREGIEHGSEMLDSMLPVKPLLPDTIQPPKEDRP